MTLDPARVKNQKKFQLKPTKIQTFYTIILNSPLKIYSEGTRLLTIVLLNIFNVTKKNSIWPK